jgi:hypothetical protein
MLPVVMQCLPGNLRETSSSGRLTKKKVCMFFGGITSSKLIQDMNIMFANQTTVHPGAFQITLARPESFLWTGTPVLMGLSCAVGGIVSSREANP